MYGFRLSEKLDFYRLRDLVLSRGLEFARALFCSLELNNFYRSLLNSSARLAKISRLLAMTYFGELLWSPFEGCDFYASSLLNSRRETCLPSSIV